MWGVDVTVPDEILAKRYAPDLESEVAGKFPGMKAIKRRVAGDILSLSNGGAVTAMGQKITTKPYRVGEPLCFCADGFRSIHLSRLANQGEAESWTASAKKNDAAVRRNLEQNPLGAFLLFDRNGRSFVSDDLSPSLVLMGRRPCGEGLVSGISELAVNPMDIVDVRDPISRMALLADTELQACLHLVECVGSEIKRLGLRVNVWDVLLHGSYSQLFPKCREAFAATRAKLDKFLE